MMTQTTASNVSPHSAAYSGNDYTIKGNAEENETSTSSMDVSSLGKDDFLKLLIAQIQYQDPLNPADNTEFIAQLAQFTSLEQMTNMNTNLEQVLTSNTAIGEAVSNAMIISYFDKTVTVESQTIAYSGEGETSLVFELENAALTGKVTIKDENGAIIESREFTNAEAGVIAMDWNGFTALGTQAEEGIYTVEIEAFDAADGEVDATLLYTGKVEGISYKEGMAHLVVDDMLIPFTHVREIINE